MDDYIDQDALLLLDELKKYWLAFGGDLPSPKSVTVSEVAGDLLDSLPRSLIVPDYAVLEPDALTRSHYRTDA